MRVEDVFDEDILKIVMVTMDDVFIEGTRLDNEGDARFAPWGPPYYIIDGSKGDPDVGHPGDLLEEFDTREKADAALMKWKLAVLKDRLKTSKAGFRKMPVIKAAFEKCASVVDVYAAEMEKAAMGFREDAKEATDPEDVETLKNNAKASDKAMWVLREAAANIRALD